MSLVEIQIPSLLRGVSQQPPVTRLPGQVTAADNAYPSIVNGLGKRQPSQHVARLMAGAPYVAHVHTIHRDLVERYKLIAGADYLRVFDADNGREYKVIEAITGDPVVDFLPDYLDTRRPNPFLPTLGDHETFSAWGLNPNTTIVFPDATQGTGPLGFPSDNGLAHVGADGAAVAEAGIFNEVNSFLPAGHDQVFSIYAKKHASFSIANVELGFIDTTLGLSHLQRFDVDGSGVFTLSTTTTGVRGRVTDVGNGWYLLEIIVQVGQIPTTDETSFRRVRVRFNVGGPFPNARALLWGARLDEFTDTAAPYMLERALKAVSIADYTLLLNTEKTVTASASEAEPVDSANGFIFVRTGGSPDVRYQVIVRYTLAGVPTSATFTHTTTSTATTYQTDAGIAEGLRALIDAHADFIATRNGSVVRVIQSGPTVRLVSLEVSDSRGDRNMVGFVFSIEKFTDLPLVCIHNHLVHVTGDPEREADDYWVRFVASDPAVMSKGEWEESGLARTLDGVTLPYQLIRRQDDSVGAVTGVPNDRYFELSRNEAVSPWENRIVGDDDSNDAPSVVGGPISDVIFHRNRLILLAEDNVVTSEAGNYFNLWRTTVLQILDSDPIDITVGHSQVASLHSGAAVAEQLLLLSDRNQFLLVGDPVLTPNTAQVQAARAIASDAGVDVIEAGREVLFADSRGAFAGVQGATLLADSINLEVEDITAHTPRYLPGRVRKLTHASLRGLTVALVTGDTSAAYVHRSEWSGGQRVQSAWGRWLFGDGAELLDADFVETVLGLVVRRAEGVFLENILVSEETADPGLESLTYLDRRVAPTSKVYAAGVDKTTVTLPYNIEVGETMMVVDQSTSLIVPIVSQTTNTVVLLGDFSARALWVGQRYLMSIELTEPVQQTSGQDGSRVPAIGRPVEVRYLNLTHGRSAFYSVEVIPRIGPPSEEEFAGAALGTGEYLMGELELEDGDRRFAIFMNSKEGVIRVENDSPFPSWILAGSFEVNIHRRAALA